MGGDLHPAATRSREWGWCKEAFPLGSSPPVAILPFGQHLDKAPPPRQAKGSLLGLLYPSPSQLPFYSGPILAGVRMGPNLLVVGKT